MYLGVYLLGTVASQCRDTWVKQPVMGTWRGPFSFSVLHLVVQWCLTLCDPMNCSPPGSSVLGIFQARIPEWVAMPSSRGSSQPRD